MLLTYWVEGLGYLVVPLKTTTYYGPVFSRLCQFLAAPFFLLLKYTTAQRCHAGYGVGFDNAALRPNRRQRLICLGSPGPSFD